MPGSSSGRERAVLVDPAAGVLEAVARDVVENSVQGRPGMLVQYAGDARAQLESTLGTVQAIGSDWSG
jgi:hypothetical protein